MYTGKRCPESIIGLPVIQWSGVSTYITRPLPFSSKAIVCWRSLTSACAPNIVVLSFTVIVHVGTLFLRSLDSRIYRCSSLEPIILVLSLVGLAFHYSSDCQATCNARSFSVVVERKCALVETK